MSLHLNSALPQDFSTRGLDAGRTLAFCALMSVQALRLQVHVACLQKHVALRADDAGANHSAHPHKAPQSLSVDMSPTAKVASGPTT